MMTVQSSRVSARPCTAGRRSVVVSASSQRQPQPVAQQAVTGVLSTLLGASLLFGSPQVAEAGGNSLTTGAPSAISGAPAQIGTPPEKTAFGRLASGIRNKWSIGQNNKPGQNVSSLLGSSSVSNTAAPTNEGPTGKRSVQGDASKPGGILSVKANSKFGGGSADGAGAAQTIGAGSGSNKGSSEVNGPTGNMGRINTVPDAATTGFSKSKL